MPTADRKLRVFLCHSSQDKPIVRELYQQLNAEGWIDAATMTYIQIPLSL